MQVRKFSNAKCKIHILRDDSRDGNVCGLCRKGLGKGWNVTLQISYKCLQRTQLWNFKTLTAWKTNEYKPLRKCCSHYFFNISTFLHSQFRTSLHMIQHSAVDRRTFGGNILPRVIIHQVTLTSVSNIQRQKRKTLRQIHKRHKLSYWV